MRKARHKKEKCCLISHTGGLDKSDPQRQEVDGGAGAGGGDGESVFHEDRVSVWEYEKALEMMVGMVA